MAAVDDQREQHGSFRADVTGEPPEEEREGHAHELHDDERQDDGVLAQADLRAVDAGHADDGVDAVVVDGERHQQQEGLAVQPQFAERLPQAREPGRQQAAGPCLTGLAARRRLGDAPQDRHREREPPDGHAQEREPRRERAAGHAEPLGLRDPGRVDDQQEAAAQVPDGVGGRRDAIDFVRRRDVRQQRIGERDAAGRADVPHHEQEQAPAASRRARRTTGTPSRRRRSRGRRRASASSGRRSRRWRPAPARWRPRQPRPAPRSTRSSSSPAPAGRSAASTRAKYMRKDHGDDRGPEGRIGPVVHRPGPQLGAVQPEPIEPALAGGF